MFWTLIAAVFAGLAGAGIGMGLRKLTGDRLPKGIIPVMAGVMMIVATVGQEYAWYPNNLDDLPGDAVVLSEREQQAIYQPWTFIRPWVRGFIAYSPEETVETADNSGIFVIQAHIRERWQPAMIRPVLIDCTQALRGDILPGTTFNDQGQPDEVRWSGEGENDTIIATVCGGEPPAS